MKRRDQGSGFRDRAGRILTPEPWALRPNEFEDVQ